jgi:thiol:disulfide interchange protein
LLAAGACSSPGPTASSPAPIVAIGAPDQASEALVVAHAGSVDERPRASPGPLRWESAEPEARAKARREELPMLIYLRADWAVASVQMEREVWSDPRVILEARRFVPVKIDLTRAEGDAEVISQRYGAPSVPAVIVLDVHGQRAALVSGPSDADEILEAMQRALE